MQHNIGIEVTGHPVQNDVRPLLEARKPIAGNLYFGPSIKDLNGVIDAPMFKSFQLPAALLLGRALSVEADRAGPRGRNGRQRIRGDLEQPRRRRHWKRRRFPASPKHKTHGKRSL